MSLQLGLVILGQTPRPDFVAPFAEHWPESQIHLAGALDRRCGEEIAELNLGPDSYLLHARLASGRAIKVSAEAMGPYLQRAVDRLVEAGVGLVVVLCTAAFEQLTSPVPLVLPGVLAPRVLDAYGVSRRLGVVAPLAEQVPHAEKKWTADGYHPVLTAVAPNSDLHARRAGLAEASSRLVARGADLVLLDCFGFDAADAAFVSAMGHVPAMATQDLTSRVVGALRERSSTEHYPSSRAGLGPFEEREGTP